MRWLLPFCALACCSATDLEHRIDALVDASAPAGRGSIGIHVVDLATGRAIYGRNEDQLFLPASNMKLPTAALALQRLGGDYRFKTRVLQEPGGDVLLIGSGDPSFSSRAYPYAKGPRAEGSIKAMEDLADELVARGVHQVNGDIVGDDGLYPWEPIPPSWTANDREGGDGAPVSALTFNDNVVAVRIAHGAGLGDPAKLTTPFEYLTLRNEVISGPRGEQPYLQTRQVPGSGEWVVSGSIPVGSTPSSIEIPVADPAEYAAAALYDALTRRGVAIRGRPVARHRMPGTTYVAPTGEEIASRMSPPLTELLAMMLKLSQNLHAELLFREAGRVALEQATNDGGIAALAAFLKERGIAPVEWRAEDGSGLSRNDLLTPRLITHLLTQEFRQHGDLWTAMLPAGGEDGTLDHRLCCVSEGRGIRAKTGTLSRAIALSGYAESAANGHLAFSILVNNFSAPASEVRQWIDRIATELLE